ncbi:hypothetical protein QT397_06570 [Microbulbifer sp. MKSA007]|nr:hypothetical protein QT397_06570 [Microbulbifer sp. MKSA007]
MAAAFLKAFYGDIKGSLLNRLLEIKGFKHMDRKTISAVAWAISSCIFLWLFSLVQAEGLSSPPGSDELFKSFCLFSFMLLGGGACYHFLTEIIFSPYTSENAHLWVRLSKYMVSLMLVLISMPSLMLVFRENLHLSTAWILSFFYLLTGYGVSAWLGTRIKPIFIEIRSMGSLQTVDNMAG